jgi:transcriptional regulator with XRE-family HTH domain
VVVLARIFDLYTIRYGSLSELARAMGISVSQVYRVREGKRKINRKFIVGAIQAFPEYRFGDLFYVARDDRPEEPAVTILYQRHGSAVYNTRY